MMGGPYCTLLAVEARSPVIPLLLAHPDIDVNVKNTFGDTPFFYACNGRTSCAREMLKDSMVKVNEPQTSGSTPLKGAAVNGHLEAIKWWIVSGRKMDLGTPGDVDKTDAIGAAKKEEIWHGSAQNMGKREVVALLGRFQSDAIQTRHVIRVEVGWYNVMAAEMFAMVVFVSDGLLKTKATGVKAGAKRTRFFNIARSLPLELQMVLCHLVVGSAKEIIQGDESEVAFVSLN